MSGTALVSAALLAMCTLAGAGESRQLVEKTPPPVADRAVLLQRADEAERAGRSAEAVRLLRLAAVRYQSVRAYVELARLQTRAGDTKGALASLSTARSLAPNAEDVLSGHAELSLAAKMPLTGVRTLQPRRAYPMVPHYHYLLGVGLIATGACNRRRPAGGSGLPEPNQAPTLPRSVALNTASLYPGQDRARAAFGLQPDSTDTVAALAEAEADSASDDAAQHAQQALDRVLQCHGQPRQGYRPDGTAALRGGSRCPAESGRCGSGFTPGGSSVGPRECASR